MNRSEGDGDDDMTGSSSSSSGAREGKTSEGGESKTSMKSDGEDSDGLKQLLALGFSRRDAINALSSTGGNAEMAAALLFDTTGK